jgi:predicted nuclease with TOPRIM domain
MKKTLKNKVTTIRNKMYDLIDELTERRYELEERDDQYGKYEEELEEIENLTYILEQAIDDLCEYED